MATSLLQARLDSPWLALANSASPWLLFAFLVGVGRRSPGAALLSGLATCLLELVGYYVTAHLRSYDVSSNRLVFWSACALVGGPVFGLAGHWWRWASGRLAGLGGSVLPAAFLAEALVGYGLRLHYWGSALLFAVLGLAALVVLARGPSWSRLTLGLCVAFPLACLAELVLGVAG